MSGSTAWADGGGLSGTFSNNVTVIGVLISPSGVRTLDANGAHSRGIEVCVSLFSNVVTTRFDAAGQFLALGSQVSPYTLFASSSYDTNATDCYYGHALYGHATYIWWNADPAINIQEAAPAHCSSLVPPFALNGVDLPGWCDPITMALY
jgi:hypothetical protein